MSAHEGVSVWNRETAAGLAKRIRFEFSRSITPNTADLLAMAEEKQSDTVSFKEVRERLTAYLGRELHCPARHPVFAIELRISMSARDRHKALKLFPNLDGFPFSYLPIRTYFCPVCQEVYRQREIDEAMIPPAIHDSEEVAHASAR